MFFKYPIVLLLYLPIAVLTVALLQRTMIAFSNPKEKDEFIRRNRFIKRFLMVSRLLIFLLLTIALAGPFTFEEKPVKGELALTILVDNSTSFAIFDPAVSERLHAAIESKVPVTIKTIGTGEISAIGDSILSNIQGNDNFLLVTDGNTNYGKSLGDVILFASNLNTTINAMDLTPRHSDSVVWIEGATESIVGSESEFTVNVNSAGQPNPYRVTVDIDGQQVLDQSSQGPQAFPVTQKLAQGYHRVTARITPSGEDFFPQHDVFYKSINIIEQPKIAVVHKKPSPLLDQLSTLYRVSDFASMPVDFGGATAVILDDLPAAEFSPEEIDRLTDYITDGNGLLVIGGESSFDKGAYKDSLL